MINLFIRKLLFLAGSGFAIAIISGILNAVMPKNVTTQEIMLIGANFSLIAVFILFAAIVYSRPDAADCKTTGKTNDIDDGAKLTAVDQILNMVVMNVKDDIKVTAGEEKNYKISVAVFHEQKDKSPVKLQEKSFLVNVSAEELSQ